jgi:hypothetical protein
MNNDSCSNVYKLQYKKDPITLDKHFSLSTRTFHQQYPMNMGPILNTNWAVMVDAIRSFERL